MRAISYFLSTAALISTKLSALALAGLFLCLSISAEASLITIDFSAELFSVSDPDRVLDGSVMIGTSVIGSYTFDPQMSDSSASDPLFGRYRNFPLTSGTQFTATLGNYQVSASSGFSITVTDGQGAGYVPDWDGYGVSSGGTTYLTNGTDVLTNQSFLLSLDINDGTVISTDLLPKAPPNLDNYGFRHWDMVGFVTQSDGSQSRFSTDGQIISLQVRPVPEPATLALLGIGLAGFGLRRGADVVFLPHGARP